MVCTGTELLSGVPTKKTTYANECPKCGGYSQKGPFHISKEPRLGKRRFRSLYWTYVVLCTPEVLEGLRASDIVGYEEWPVLLRRTREPSTQVSQLVFPVVAAPGLADESKLEPATCPVCGLTKYGFCKRGQLHIKRESLSTDVDAQLTYEWFGSGRYGGFREILVSSRLARRGPATHQAGLKYSQRCIAAENENART